MNQTLGRVEYVSTVTKTTPVSSMTSRLRGGYGTYLGRKTAVRSGAAVAA
jgi:hypothetical protein